MRCERSWADDVKVSPRLLWIAGSSRFMNMSPMELDWVALVLECLGRNIWVELALGYIVPIWCCCTQCRFNIHICIHLNWHIYVYTKLVCTVAALEYSLDPANTPHMRCKHNLNTKNQGTVFFGHGSYMTHIIHFISMLSWIYGKIGKDFTSSGGKFMHGLFLDATEMCSPKYA